MGEMAFCVVCDRHFSLCLGAGDKPTAHTNRPWVRPAQRTFQQPMGRHTNLPCQEGLGMFCGDETAPHARAGGVLLVQHTGRSPKRAGLALPTANSDLFLH